MGSWLPPLADVREADGRGAAAARDAALEGRNRLLRRSGPSGRLWRQQAACDRSARVRAPGE